MQTRFPSIYRLIFLSAALLYSFVVVGQQVEDQDLADFDRIEFVGRGEINLRQGSNPHLRLEASDIDDLRRFDTEVRGSTLRIIYEHDDEDWLNLAPKINVEITYPALRELHITGLAQLSSSDKIISDRFRLEVEGMGKVELNLAVASLDVISAGTATINLQGEAEEVNILNDGTGTVDAFDLISQSADVEVNGVGTIRVNCQQRLRAEANGVGATIKYRGDPKKTSFDTSGFASIKADY